MPDTLLAIARAAGGVPLMADTVSVSKVRRLQAILPHIAILKANRAEAAVLAGLVLHQSTKPLGTEDALRAGCRALLDAGVKQVYITLGAEGACFAEPASGPADGFGMQPVLASKLVNVNGAGDAFAAGVAFSYCGLRGRSNTAEHARVGAVCAAVTVESNDAVCKSLSREILLKPQQEERK
jgi:pseudouridine kinase